MAHYTYDYSCSHGRGSVQLFGKTCDRERKLTWLGESMVCPDCYKLRAHSRQAKARMPDSTGDFRVRLSRATCRGSGSEAAISARSRALTSRTARRS